MGGNSSKNPHAEYYQSEYGNKKVSKKEKKRAKKQKKKSKEAGYGFDAIEQPRNTQEQEWAPPLTAEDIDPPKIFPQEEKPKVTEKKEPQAPEENPKKPPSDEASQPTASPSGKKVHFDQKELPPVEATVKVNKQEEEEEEEESIFKKPPKKERKGMTQAQIDQLPLFLYHRSMSEETCSVCMRSFKDMEPLKTLPCLHKYHVGCIDEWLKNNIKCPNFNCIGGVELSWNSYHTSGFYM